MVYERTTGAAVVSVIGAQGSLIHVGSKLLLHKLMKKVILVLIERCQNMVICSLLQKKLHSHWTARVPMVTPVQCQERLQGAWCNNDLKVFKWPRNLPELNPIEHLWEQTTHGGPHLKDLLLLMSWCRIPQHTFRGPVQPWQFKVVLTVNARPTQYEAGGYIVVADWYKWSTYRW